METITKEVTAFYNHIIMASERKERLIFFGKHFWGRFLEEVPFELTFEIRIDIFSTSIEVLCS